MGTLADSLFTVLMSWVRALVNGLWALFSADRTTTLEFLGKHWLLIAVVLIAAGLVIDWIIWLIRWQPYHLWAQRARRLLRMEEPEDEEEEEEELRAHAAVTRGRSYARPVESQERDAFFPPQPFEADMSEEDAQAAMQQADSVSDAELGAYPGMRYDSPAAGGEADSGTQRYAAVHAQGPGAAEVERRRAEIDAWQLQMQEEARARAEAERAAREAERAAYEAEQARLAQEAQAAYEAEQARLAQEAQAAYEAEQARLAQEEYQRQLAEYERQKAQYERDLAEYERQKAEYEAQLAAQAAAQENADDAQPYAQAESEGAAPSARRRRSVKRTYSDYVEGEAVSELPDAPQWPQMQHAPAQEKQQDEPHKKEKSSGLLGRMARMIEPEEEELISRTTLPPRIDPGEAFHTAKMPAIGGGRKKR